MQDLTKKDHEKPGTTAKPDIDGPNSRGRKCMT